MSQARSLGLALSVLLFAHLVLLGFFQILDADTWWHLKEGELYATTLSLPAQDSFAFTTVGREWMKYSWVAASIWSSALRACRGSWHCGLSCSS